MDPDVEFLNNLHLALDGAKSFQQKINILIDFNLQLPENYQFDYIVENQRGIKMIGIPMFSSKSLLPLIDPGHYLSLKGTRINIVGNNLDTYQPPDLNWKWCWPSWYVLMFNDIDDQGWLYAKVFFNNRWGNWKGKHYFGNFIRKRIWIRLRKSD